MPKLESKWWLDLGFFFFLFNKCGKQAAGFQCSGLARTRIVLQCHKVRMITSRSLVVSSACVCKFHPSLFHFALSCDTDQIPDVVFFVAFFLPSIAIFFLWSVSHFMMLKWICWRGKFLTKSRWMEWIFVKFTPRGIWSVFLVRFKSCDVGKMHLTVKAISLVTLWRHFINCDVMEIRGKVKVKPATSWKNFCFLVLFFFIFISYFVRGNKICNLVSFIGSLKQTCETLNCNLHQDSMFCYFVWPWMENMSAKQNCWLFKWRESFLCWLVVCKYCTNWVRGSATAAGSLAGTVFVFCHCDHISSEEDCSRTNRSNRHAALDVEDFSKWWCCFCSPEGAVWLVTFRELLISQIWRGAVYGLQNCKTLLKRTMNLSVNGKGRKSFKIWGN